MTKTGIGCIIASILGSIGLVAGVVSLLVYSNFRNQKMYQHDLMEQHASLSHSHSRIEISAKDYSINSDEPISEKKYISIMLSPNGTDLARQKFSESIDSKRVKWDMKVESISESDANQITAEFTVPYTIRDGRSSVGSTLYISSSFPLSATEQLLQLRTNQWVTIEGQLKSDPNRPITVEILKPSLIGPSASPTSSLSRERH